MPRSLTPLDAANGNAGKPSYSLTTFENVAGTERAGGVVLVDQDTGPISPATESTLASRASEATLAALNAKVANTASGALLMGTARDRFFDNFADFNTVDDWELVQTGPGMSAPVVAGGAAAGSSPYLLISSGTTINSKTIIISRATFNAPVDLRYQISASQRIANNRLMIGFVQVDDTGAIVTSTSITTAPDVLNARNAVMHQHDGTVATTANLRVRAAGSALDTFANAFGTGFTTVATGTGPNWLSATTYGLTFERDRINARAYGQNVTTNTGGQFAYDRVMPNPTVRYKLAIIVENLGTAPASSTDWRVHLINVMDATRLDVSPRNAGTVDGAKAFPIWAVGGSMSVTATLASTTVTSSTAAIPTIIADVASAALTTTTTTTALTPTGGSSYQVVIPVTAVSGTTPTLDIGVEESDDTGTNWFRVYDFPRITATGVYRSPKLPLTGNRVRYVQTVGGTTPSFTRAVNRLQSNESVPSIRQLIDRSLAATQTLNAVTASLNVQNCTNAQLLVTAGAITTTAPAFQLEGSDDNGLTWYAIGTPLTAVASSTVRSVVIDTNSQLIRARVSIAGAGATLTHVLLKGF